MKFQKALQVNLFALFVSSNMFASIHERCITGLLVFCQKLKNNWIKTGNRIIDVVAYIWILLVLCIAVPYIQEILYYLLNSPVFTFSMLWSLLKFVAIIYIATKPARIWLMMSNIVKNNRYNPFMLKMYHKYIGFKKPQFQV